MTTKHNCGYCYYCCLPFLSVSTHQPKCKSRSDAPEVIKQRHVKRRQCEIERLTNSRSYIDGHYMNATEIFSDIPWLDKYTEGSNLSNIRLALRLSGIPDVKVLSDGAYWHRSLVLHLAQSMSAQLYVDLLRNDVSKEVNPTIEELKSTIEVLKTQVESLTRSNVEALQQITELCRDPAYLKPLPTKGNSVPDLEKKAEIAKKALQTRKETIARKAATLQAAKALNKRIERGKEQLYRDNTKINNYIFRNSPDIREKDALNMLTESRDELKNSLKLLEAEWKDLYSHTYEVVNDEVVLRPPVVQPRLEPVDVPKTAVTSVPKQKPIPLTSYTHEDIVGNARKPIHPEDIIGGAAPKKVRVLGGEAPKKVPFINPEDIIGGEAPKKVPFINPEDIIGVSAAPKKLSFRSYDPDPETPEELAAIAASKEMDKLNPPEKKPNLFYRPPGVTTESLIAEAAWRPFVPEDRKQYNPGWDDSKRDFTIYDTSQFLEPDFVIGSKEFEDSIDELLKFKIKYRNY